MTPSTAIRVAATQFASGTDVDENLATCLRMIDQAAAKQPDLIVLPEFCNHISVYESEEHCRDVAVDIDGPFLNAIADRASRNSAWIVLAVTLRHDDDRVTISNVMYDDAGSLVAVSDKQVLMGNERTYLVPGTTAGPIMDSPFGPIAMYSCMEGVVFEPPRSLAIRGARLLTNSLNSFGLDEASLHIPVRAAENRVFIVAANKVGPLIPHDRVHAFAEAMGISPEALDGAGESQIVDPNGTVLAKAPRTGEAVIVADIDLSAADSKKASSGTDLHANRRADRYRSLATRDHDIEPTGSDAPITVAMTSDETLGSTSADLIVFPELIGVHTDPGVDISAAVEQSRSAVSGLAAQLADGQIAVTTIVERTPSGAAHTAVAVGPSGIITRQRQMHLSSRHAWATVLADTMDPVDTQWGSLGLIAGDDVLFPESFRLHAIQGASVVAVSTQILDQWLMDLGIPERSAENRIHVVVGSERSPGCGPIAAVLPSDMTLWLPDRSRPFDGTINTPDTVVGDTNPTTVSLIPARARNKLVSTGTDLVTGRPVEGAGAALAQN